MKFGAAIPNYGETASPDALVAVATGAERLGFDSVWSTDHILMPRGSGTPYERIYDSLLSLAYVASATKTVRLGISALIVAMRNPVVAVKQLATIDALSGGRAMVAIGTGWNVREFSNVGSNFRTRGRRVDETIRLLKELYDGKTSFEGRKTGIKFDDVVFEPRGQKRIPVWIGGVSPAAMKRAVKFGDAWHPNVSPLADFQQLVSRFRSVPGAENKEIHVRIGVNAKSQVSEYTGAQGNKVVQFSANADENKSIMDALKGLRVDGIVAVPSPAGKTGVEDQLEGLRMIHDQFMG